MGNLSEQVALVTGAGRGIGRAIALALAKEGVHLAIVARSQNELEDLAQKVSQLGVRAEIYAGDLLDSEFISGLVPQVEAQFSRLDILVNNAGIAPAAPLEKTTLESFERCMDLNVKVPFQLCRAVVPLMKSSGRGRIVNIASTAALKGYPYTSAYVASKHALLGLTRALAKELLSKNITVNAVCPGFVETDITRAAIQNITKKTGRSEDEAMKSLASDSALDRLIQPEEVAYAVLTFLGPMSDAYSGVALPIAGDAV